MPAILSPPEQRVVLRDVSWETYERLLAELADSSSPRLTFDHGDLEIMSPHAEHERYNVKLADFIGVLAEEMDIDVEALGATTFGRQELDRGFEPDSCFYVQHAGRMRGKERIDLTIDPPPDLLIEIEFTRPAINKLAVFAAFGVPELWLYNGDRLAILRLSRGRYEAAEKSVVFSGISAPALTELLQEGKALGRTGWIKLTRAWVRERYGRLGQ
jgi:Uma2 family endonuclease